MTESRANDPRGCRDQQHLRLGGRRLVNKTVYLLYLLYHLYLLYRYIFYIAFCWRRGETRLEINKAIALPTDWQTDRRIDSVKSRLEIINDFRGKILGMRLVSRPWTIVSVCEIGKLLSVKIWVLINFEGHSYPQWRSYPPSMCQFCRSSKLLAFRQTASGIPPCSKCSTCKVRTIYSAGPNIRWISVLRASRDSNLLIF